MNQETSQIPVKALALVVALVVVGLAYVAVQYTDMRAEMSDLREDYRVLVNTDVANIAPSSGFILLNTPPHLVKDVLPTIVVAEGEVESISSSEMVLNAKIVDLGRIENILAGKEQLDLSNKPEKIEKMTVAITPQTTFYLENEVKAGDTVHVVTYEPILYSDTLTAKYIFPSIPGLTN